MRLRHCLGQFDAGLPAALTQGRHCRVRGDARDPGAKSLGLAQRRQGAYRLQERVLSDVIGVCVASDQVNGDGVDARRMPVEEHGEGGLVTT